MKLDPIAAARAVGVREVAVHAAEARVAEVLREAAARGVDPHEAVVVHDAAAEVAVEAPSNFVAGIAILSGSDAVTTRLNRKLR